MNWNIWEAIEVERGETIIEEEASKMMLINKYFLLIASLNTFFQYLWSEYCMPYLYKISNIDLIKIFLMPPKKTSKK